MDGIARTLAQCNLFPIPTVSNLCRLAGHSGALPEAGLLTGRLAVGRGRINRQ